MATTGKLEVQNQDILGALKELFTKILAQEDIGAILVPRRLPMKNTVMPTLVTDPESLEGVDPLSPAFPLNSAKVVSRLTRKASGGHVAAVMRPCEIRAFVELVKLKQGRVEDLVIIGVDCLGAFRNTDYSRWVAGDSQGSTQSFVAGVLGGDNTGAEGMELAPACRACEAPVAHGADIAVGLYGLETDQGLLVEGRTAKGEALLKGLELADMAVPTARKKAIATLVAERTAFRDNLFSETHAATDSLEKLTGYLASCVNCFNCRVACPVCYCRECVFVTDVFDHEPSQYLRWAERKGAVKLPTDTLFYHITRLAHMSTACVGCGQCSNACPNEIPVMELFRTIAHRTQLGFDYKAGRSIDEKPPLSEFREDEFAEVVGIE